VEGFMETTGMIENIPSMAQYKNSNEKIRVAIVEDDIDWLKSMTMFINRHEDICVVGLASSKEEAVSLLKNTNFDVILMDINLNENMCDGILATIEILQFSKAKIIMLSALKEQDIIEYSFIAGAVNFISKERYMHIPDAIRDTYKNASPIEVVLNKFMELKREEQLKDLTVCEKQIYNLLEKGYSKSKIEKELFKSANTIKSQVKKILWKLGVASSREAIHKVKTGGLMEKLRCI
jgi:Response regulator containing a CheY-like receiver domain and an HTH DNA-binding domain